MGRRHSVEFRNEAVRLALTIGLTRKQLAADLGIGCSTLNKWVQHDRHKDLISGPHEDQDKELARLRKENRIAMKVYRVAVCDFCFCRLYWTCLVDRRDSRVWPTPVMASNLHSRPLRYPIPDIHKMNFLKIISKISARVSVLGTSLSARLRDSGQLARGGLYVCETGDTLTSYQEVFTSNPLFHCDNYSPCLS